MVQEEERVIVTLFTKATDPEVKAVDELLSRVQDGVGEFVDIHQSVARTKSLTSTPYKCSTIYAR
jgi:hypothetical protein